MIEGIERARVDQHWPAVKPWIGRALMRCGSLLTLAEVRRRLDARQMQMWIVRAAPEARSLVVITEIYDSAAGLTCSIPIAGGRDLTACLDDLDVIEVWAREQGCVRMCLEGRRGWQRVLAPQGWRLATVQLEKRL